MSSFDQDYSQQRARLQDERRVGYALLDAVVTTLHYLENLDRIDLTATTEVLAALEGGKDAYRNNVIFRAKADAMVAAIHRSIDLHTLLDAADERDRLKADLSRVGKLASERFAEGEKLKSEVLAGVFERNRLTDEMALRETEVRRLNDEVARLRAFVDAWDNRYASPSIQSAPRLAKARAALEEKP